MTAAWGNVSDRILLLLAENGPMTRWAIADAMNMHCKRTISSTLRPTRNTNPDCRKAIWKRSGRGRPRRPSSSSSTN